MHYASSCRTGDNPCTSQGCGQQRLSNYPDVLGCQGITNEEPVLPTIAKAWGKEQLHGALSSTWHHQSKNLQTAP